MCSHYLLLQNKPHQGSLANSNNSHLLCWAICHLDRAQQGWLMEEGGPFQGGSHTWLAYVGGLCPSAGAWRACGPGALVPLHMNLFMELLGIPYSMAAESQEWVFQEQEGETPNIMRPGSGNWHNRINTLLKNQWTCPDVLIIKCVRFLLFYWDIVDVQYYMFQVYNIVIHNL